MNPQVKVKETEAATVAYAAMKGSVDQIPGTFGKLYDWIQHMGYVPVGPPVGMYFNAPGQVPADELLWEIRSPIAGAVLPSGPDAEGLGVKIEPGRQMAAAEHKGPYERLRETYGLVASWIAENGYEIAGPPEEVYFSDPAEVPPEELVTEVRFPIRRK